MKKRSFSLLEVLIGLALSSILFAVLLGAYFQAQYAAIKVAKEEKDRFPEKFLLHRLSEVFLNLSQDVDQTAQFFYTLDLAESLGNAPALLFSYDNGMVLTPWLSGNVLGLLFLDQDKNLTLITWPSRDKWADDKPQKMHREVLWSNIEIVRFDFFYVPENNGEAGKAPSWLRGAWPKEIKGVPAAIELFLETSEKKNHSFLFPIPSQLAIFREKK
jgi:hypothetical protein